jgi:hypothetical protein
VTPADAEVFELLADWAVTLPVTFLLIRSDERRLRGAELARAWPPSSRDGAILGFFLLAAGFTPLVIAFHWTRTRASLAGFAIGVGLFLLVEALGIGAAWAVECLAV